MKKKKIIFYLLFVFSFNTFSMKSDSTKTRKYGHFIFASGLSYGAEHIIGLPEFTLSIQSHKSGGLYVGGQFATLIGFTYSYGGHVGIRYKFLDLEFSRNLFSNGIEKFNTKSFKIGLEYKHIQLKVGSTNVFSKFNDEIYADKFFKIFAQNYLNLELKFLLYDK